jgi:hypothetical protein
VPSGVYAAKMEVMKIIFTRNVEAKNGDTLYYGTLLRFCGQSVKCHEKVFHNVGIFPVAV